MSAFFEFLDESPVLLQMQSDVESAEPREYELGVDLMLHKYWHGTLTTGFGLDKHEAWMPLLIQRRGRLLWKIGYGSIDMDAKKEKLGKKYDKKARAVDTDRLKKLKRVRMIARAKRLWYYFYDSLQFKQARNSVENNRIRRKMLKKLDAFQALKLFYLETDKISPEEIFSHLSRQCLPSFPGWEQRERIEKQEYLALDATGVSLLRVPHPDDVREDRLIKAATELAFDVSLSLSLRLKGLFSMLLASYVNAVWCIRLYNITGIAYNHHTDIYPLTNI